MDRPAPAYPTASADIAAMERRLGARMIALGLAMRALNGEADAQTLTLAMVATKEALGPDDPVTCAVAGLARAMPQIRAGNTPLRPAAECLFRVVTRALRNPGTPDQRAGA